MKFKNAMVKKELVGWIIFLAIFISIIFVVTTMIAKQKAAAGNLACQTQLAVAAKGNPIGFSACHSYRIEFDKDAAIKYDMYQDDTEVYKYKYSDVLNKLKVRSPELDDLKISKNEIIPEEIIYYILAEEMKLCDLTYNVGSFKTGTYFFKNNELMTSSKMNICQECAIFLFKEDFFPKTQNSANFQRLNGFFQDMRATQNSNISYKEYFNAKYDDNSVLSNMDNIETNKIYKIIYQFKIDLSNIEGKRKAKELIPKDLWGYVNSEEDFAGERSYTSYLISDGLQLIDSEKSINTCDLNLLLLPKGVLI